MAPPALGGTVPSAIADTITYRAIETMLRLEVPNLQELELDRVIGTEAIVQTRGGLLRAAVPGRSAPAHSSTT